MPFEWRTPIGYIVAWAAQFVGCLAIMLACISYYGFIYASCWFFISIAQYITTDLTAVQSVKIHNGNENGAEMRERFYDIIKIYSNAKELRCTFCSI